MKSFMNNAFETGKKFLFDKFHDDPSMFLIITAALAFAAACVANIVGIKINNKITPKEKEYLIPQELADGFTNVALFLALTTSLDVMTKKLIDKGKIKFEGIEKGTKEFGVLKNGASVLVSLVTAVIASNVVTPVVRNIYATGRQKQYLDAVKKGEPVNFALPMFRNGEPPLTMNSFMAFTNNRSNLRI